MGVVGADVGDSDHPRGKYGAFVRRTDVSIKRVVQTSNKMKGRA